LIDDIEHGILSTASLLLGLLCNLRFDPARCKRRRWRLKRSPRMSTKKNQAASSHCVMLTQAQTSTIQTCPWANCVDLNTVQSLRRSSRSSFQHIHSDSTANCVQRFEQVVRVLRNMQNTSARAWSGFEMDQGGNWCIGMKGGTIVITLQ
jgi:hypothetical protein